MRLKEIAAPGRPNEPGDDIARYVLGDMTLDELLAFEVRMTNDDELARSVAAAMTFYDIL